MPHTLLETPKQLAERAGISESQVRSLIAARRLEHVPIGSRVMIPAGAFERFVQAETVKRQWRDETKAQGSAGSMSEAAGTSLGQSKAGAASAALARQTANKLKQSSRAGSTSEAAEPGRVIHLKS